MITCPWCGTHYTAFQSNCRNCGGPLSPALEPSALQRDDEFVSPPPAPRSISDSYVWRLMFADGWAITAGVFALLGAIFSMVGMGLTLGIITAFVGIPFLGLGLLFLGLGAVILNRRYQEAQKIVMVLRQGEATRGQIEHTEENLSVRINGRHPWTIRYNFQLNGRSYRGQVTTLNYPGPQLQPGKAACVLYLPNAPEVNALYPHP